MAKEFVTSELNHGKNHDHATPSLIAADGGRTADSADSLGARAVDGARDPQPARRGARDELFDHRQDDSSHACQGIVGL